LFLFLALLLATAFINYKINEFGLFGDVEGQEYRIFHNERTTKNLYSYSYIPQNFDGILIGPSLSAINMNTRALTNGKIYNLSINGGNISELRVLVDNVLKNGSINTFIICLDPYITKDSGMKSSFINKKEYYATLGSLFTFKFYLNKYIDLKKGNTSEFYDSHYGYLNYNYKYRNIKDADVTDLINERLAKYDRNEALEELHVDENAYEDLRYVLETIRKRNINIIAYYFPRPKVIFDHPNFQSSYRLYREKMDALLDVESDIVIDFNTDEFNYIRDEMSTYADLGHLRQYGAEKVLLVLDEQLGTLQ